MPRGIRIAVIKKTKAEWQEDDNLFILRGLALQCLTIKDLAGVLGVTTKTIHAWRTTCPDTIGEAIKVGRAEGDAAVVAVTFDKAMDGEDYSLDRWWRYRIGTTKPEDGEQDAAITVHIVDDLRKTAQAKDQ